MLDIRGIDAADDDLAMLRPLMPHSLTFIVDIRVTCMS